jgi:hypothetical protein
MVDNLSRKRARLLTVIGILASSFLFTGEIIGQEFIKVPTIPAFVPARDKNGAIRYLKVKEVEKIFRSKSFYHDRDIDSIIVPEHEWLKSVLDASLEFYWGQGLKGKAQNWDCDNFSMFLSSMITIYLWRAGYTDVRVAVGWMIVNGPFAWAGIPASSHALMFAITSKGPIVIEPQNGQYIELDRYPNKLFIDKVFLL